MRHRAGIHGAEHGHRLLLRHEERQHRLRMLLDHAVAPDPERAVQVVAVGEEGRLLHAGQQQAGALAGRALVVLLGVAEGIDDGHRAAGLRGQVGRVDGAGGVNAGGHRRGLRMGRHVDELDPGVLDVAHAEFEQQHLEQRALRVPAQRNADGLALEILQVAHRRALARGDQETQVSLAHHQQADRQAGGQAAGDRRVAPHAEIQVVAHHGFDHRQGRGVLAPVDGQVVAQLDRALFHRFVVDHVLRHGRIARGPRDAADRHLQRPARALRAHEGGGGEARAGHGRAGQEGPATWRVCEVLGHASLLGVGVGVGVGVGQACFRPRAAARRRGRPPHRRWPGRPRRGSGPRCARSTRRSAG